MKNEDLKVGDFLIRSQHQGRTLRKIERETRKYWVTENNTYLSKSSLTPRGYDPWRSAVFSVPREGEVEEVKLNQSFTFLINKISQGRNTWDISEKALEAARELAQFITN